MLIRPLKEKDLSRLLAIEESAHVVPWTEGVFARCWEVKYPGWVLEHNKQVIGFMLISLYEGECHILNLCIDPSAQRQGLGEYLLSEVIGEIKAKGALMAYLEVRKTNTRAIKLYKKMNFIHIGERKNYYPVHDGYEDALIFARDLGAERVQHY